MHIDGVSVVLEDAVVDEHVAATVRLGDRPRRRAAEVEPLEKCIATDSEYNSGELAIAVDDGIRAGFALLDCRFRPLESTTEDLVAVEQLRCRG